MNKWANNTAYQCFCWILDLVVFFCCVCWFHVTFQAAFWVTVLLWLYLILSYCAAVGNGWGMHEACNRLEWFAATVFFLRRCWRDIKAWILGKRTGEDKCCIPLFVHVGQSWRLPPVVGGKVIFFWLLKIRMEVISNWDTEALFWQQSDTWGCFDGTILSSQQGFRDCCNLEERPEQGILCFCFT